MLNPFAKPLITFTTFSALLVFYFSSKSRQNPVLAVSAAAAIMFDDGTAVISSSVPSVR